MARLFLYTSGSPGRLRPFHAGCDVTFGPKPSAATTGGTGTARSNYDGNITVTVDGTTVQHLDLNGRVIVQANDVTVLNCKLRGGTPPGSPLTNTAMVDCTAPGLRTVIQDCELVPDTASVSWSGVLGHDYTAQRLNVSKVVDGFGVYNTAVGQGAAATGVVILDSYVHDLAYLSPDANHGDNKTHNDGVQIQGGSGTIVRGNYFEMKQGAASEWSGGVSNPYAPAIGSAVVVTPAVGQVASCLIERNWCDWGYRGIAAIGNGFPGALGIVRNNYFGPNIALFPAGGSGTPARRAIVFDSTVSFTDLPAVPGTDWLAGNVDYDGTPALVWRETP